MDLDYMFNMSKHQDYDLSQCINIIFCNLEIFIEVKIKEHSSTTSAYLPKYWTPLCQHCQQRFSPPP